MTKICIRAGHGQNSRGQGDPGCVGGGLREDNITLQAALSLNNAIKDLYDTVLPRSDDTWIDILSNDKGAGLRKGVAAAKQAACNVFLSIHVNAAANRTANGAEAIVRSGDKAAHALAKDMLNAHCKIFGVKNRGIKERCDDLYEARTTKEMDFVLLELGFISNPNDFDMLKRFIEDRELRIAWGNTMRAAFQKHYKNVK